jgi:hypothetical protein
MLSIGWAVFWPSLGLGGCWRERMICAVVGDGRHYVVARDRSPFPVTLTCLSLLELRVLKEQRDLPPGIRQADCYCIGDDGPGGHFLEEGIERFLEEAEQLAAREREAAGLAAHRRRRRLRAVWVLAEPVPGHLVGEEILGLPAVAGAATSAASTGSGAERPGPSVSLIASGSPIG